MNETLIRAQALHAVRRFCGSQGFLRSLEEARRKVGRLPRHRLSQLGNALAWHSDRADSAARLQEAARELARLWERAGASEEAECALYLFLIRKLGLDTELRQLQQQLADAQAELEHRVKAETDARRQRTLERELRPQLRELREEHNRYARVLQTLAKQKIDSNYARPWSEQLGGLPEFSAEQAVLWRVELRLRLALAAVQIVQLLQGTAELQDEVEAWVKQEKGVFPWR